MKLASTFFLLLLLNNLAIAQESPCNIYEVDKGEILKKDYIYLDHIYNDMFIALPMMNKDFFYQVSDITGIINTKEEILLPFRFRNVKKLNNPYDDYKDRIPLLAASNGKSRTLYKYENNKFIEIAKAVVLNRYYFTYL